MDKVLERLLLKGSIVVKKAYCDWERYKEFNFFFQAEDGIRDWSVTGVQTCALPISIEQHQACFVRAPAAPLSLPRDFAPPAGSWRRKNLDRPWPSPALARSKPDVVRWPASRM